MAYLLEDTRVLGSKLVRALNGRPGLRQDCLYPWDAAMNVPDEVPELLESLLVLRIKLELRLGLDEQPVLEPSLTKDETCMYMRVVVDDLLYSGQIYVSTKGRQ